MLPDDRNACAEFARLSRRKFMALSGAAVALPACFPRVSFARDFTSAPQDVIVQIYLRGGIDGLSLVVPWNEPSYAAARPQLKLTAPDSGATAVLDPGTGATTASPTAPGGQVSFGFHPALAPLMTAYNDGKLAFVHATGLTNTNKSHFDAQRFMEVARINDATLGTGWLGRHLITQTTPMNPAGVLRAVGVADGLQRSLIGADKAVPIPVLSSSTGNPASNLTNFDNYGLTGASSSRAARQLAIDNMHEAFGGPLNTSANNSLATIQLLNSIGASNYTSSIPVGNNPADYPTSSLGNALRSSAALINAQVGVEAIAIDVSGWDTHNNQGTAANGIAAPGTTFYDLVAGLAASLSAFYADIIVGKGRRVIVVVLTEFGRRLGQNGTLGTDHGYASTMFILGNAVVGGRVLANWPGLSPAQPATNVDLPVTIDYRDVLAEIVSKRLGNAANLATVFPGYTPQFRSLIA
jgi:uncharacterized protein (DUF1501 family)